MNVLVLHSELGVLRGGGENFTRNLFTAFSERGHKVAAAFVADQRGRYPISLPSTIKPIPIRGWWSRNLGQATLLRMAKYISLESGRPRATWDRIQDGFSWRMVSWHNRRFARRIEHEFASQWNHYDVLYVHGDVILASKVARHRPTVLRLPGPVSAEFSPLLRKVPLVCANGDALKQISGFLRDNLMELSPGLDGQLFTPGPTQIRHKLGWTNQNWIVGYVGRLTQVKGVDLLAAAFQELSRAVGHARLIIVGQGEAEATIRSVLAKEVEQGMVHIEPGVDHKQLPQWYRAMDLLVMPSRYENFSNTILEAMACGVPTLASDIGGNSILPSGAGFLFQANSVVALIDSLRRAAMQNGRMNTHAMAASRFVRERYSWAASAERLESIMTVHLGAKE
jgi:glycosyltransferase involved in cell wall biosynthesis